MILIAGSMTCSTLSRIPRSCWWRGIGCGAIRVRGPPGWTALRLNPSRCGLVPGSFSARCDPVSGIVVSSAAGAGADDSQERRQAAPPGDRDDHRPGGAGVLEAGAGAYLPGGFPPVVLPVS